MMMFVVFTLQLISCCPLHDQKSLGSGLKGVTSVLVRDVLMTQHLFEAHSKCPEFFALADVPGVFVGMFNV